MVQRWYQDTTATWGDVLDARAEECPDKVFVKFKDTAVTYKDFRSSVDRFSLGLLEVGVEKGENIAVWMGNRLEWLYAQYAIYKLGCVLVPLYTRWKSMEIEYALRQSDATTLIIEENFLGKIDALAMLRELLPEVMESDPLELRSEKFPRLRRVIVLGKNRPKGTLDFARIMRTKKKKDLHEEFRRVQDAVDPFDVMNIMYTSGTTGFPKGGMSMHRNNMATAQLWAGERMGICADDRLLNNLPFYSNLGCFIGYITLLCRASMVFTEVFEAKETLEIIEREKITTAFGTPPMFAMLMDHEDFRKRDVKSLKKGAIGGSSIPPSLFKRVVAELGVSDMVSGYGLSEAGAVSNSTFPGDSVETRARTVGTALPNFCVKVVDPKTGMSLAAGEQGEIWLRSYYTGSGIGKGYYNMANKTAEYFVEDGWFRTGDLGVMDERGYLSITGRLKDMALVGGFNVYPAEIEEFLVTHPKVQQAFVLGVPDRRLGEVIMAYIVPKSGQAVKESEITEFCKEKIGNYKVPKYVRLVDISEIPFSGHEKVQKYKLKERAVKEFGLEELT